MYARNIQYTVIVEGFRSVADGVDFVSGYQVRGCYIPGSVARATTLKIQRSPLLDNHVTLGSDVDLYRPEGFAAAQSTAVW